MGIDSHAAGRTAGVLMGRFLGARPARVMLTAPSMLLRDSIEKGRGFDEVMLAEPAHPPKELAASRPAYPVVFRATHLLADSPLREDPHLIDHGNWAPDRRWILS